MKLIFVGDPMCSWCYGFGKELTLLTERYPGLSLEIVVGGLRAGATDVLDNAGKQFRLSHWSRVEEASGLPFNREGLMARVGFVYDTEPICRAVVAARIIAPQADLLKVFRALQHTFYVDALDTTDGHVLSKAAANALSASGTPVDEAAFYKVWASDKTIAEAKADFVRARTMGIQSFPALLLEVDGQVLDVSPGYASVDELDKKLSRLLNHVGVPS